MISNYPAYSINTKIKLIPILVNIYSNKTKTKQFLNVQKLLTIFNFEIRTTKIDELLFNISILISNISRNVDKLPSESILYLYNIYIYIFGDEFIIPCIKYGSCGLFYFYFSNINYLADLDFVKHILIKMFDFEEPFSIYYTIQILKLCYLNLTNDKIIEIHNLIDFNKFHKYIDHTDNVYPSLTCFECVARRGSNYIYSLIDCEIYQHIIKIYNEVDFEVKNSINNFFSITFEECNKQQSKVLMNLGLF